MRNNNLNLKDNLNNKKDNSGNNFNIINPYIPEISTENKILRRPQT